MFKGLESSECERSMHVQGTPRAHAGYDRQEDTANILKDVCNRHAQKKCSTAVYNCGVQLPSHDGLPAETAGDVWTEPACDGAA